MKAISIHKAIITHHLKQKMVRNTRLTTNHFVLNKLTYASYPLVF